MKQRSKKKNDTEQKLLPIKRKLLLPEKSEANIPMTLTPVTNESSTIARFTVMHTKHGYIVGKPNQQHPLTTRLYSGKPKRGKLLRVGLRTFRLRMLTDASFRNLIISNRYVYVNGLLVLAPIAYEILNKKISIFSLLNHPLLGNKIRDYIMQETPKQESNTVVTETAIKHYTVNAHGGVAARTNNGTGINHGSTTTDSISYALTYKAIPAPCDVAYNEYALKQLSKQMSELFNKYGANNTDKPPESFRKLFESIVEGYDIHDLAEMTGISSRTIERIKNEKGGRPQLRHLVAICIAVKSMPTSTLRLIELAGLQFRDTLEEQTYLALVNTCYMFGVEYCNKLLDKLHIKPLTNLGVK